MNVGLIPAKWAHQTPDNDAIVDSTTGRRITFAELDSGVRKLANALIGLGLQKGDRVGILSMNSIESCTLYFACGLAGLIAQPVNWRLSSPELKKIVDNGRPRVFITQGQYAEVAAEIAEVVDCIEHWFQYGDGGDGSYEGLVEAAADEEPPGASSIGGEDPLLILYTGGTTGESKGALHSHESVQAAMLNQTVAERIVPSDVYLLTGQMFHIPVVLAINYLAHGCTLVLMNFDAELALELIARERVSAFLGVTTMLNWMMAVPGFDDYDLSSLRNIQYGGGPMPSRVIEEALDKFPCTLIQGYGQTEGAGMTFLSQEDHLRAVRDGYHPERLKSCGREGSLTSLRIVDDEGVDVPVDGKTTGQIIVKSKANMLGYFGNPELTAETIRDGWMWTGDVAAMDVERYVYIFDRAKDMIISGGENIYSAQVEEAIGRHPAVLESAVIGIPDDQWGESVKAYVVLKPGAVATEEEVIATAKAGLASYQKPRLVEFIDELPKAPTGKILKRVLRDPHWVGIDRGV
ncbi:MAG: AMP-binding protein [Gemmatimonadetes bacterium]|nr:AMP-binding protein [Gemmatimonadota bacterium]